MMMNILEQDDYDCLAYLADYVNYTNQKPKS